jgi:translation elongation factor EF-Tu-like GTPase
MLEIAIDSVFHIKGQGTVLAGRVVSGRVSVGDTVDLRSPQRSVRSVVAGLEIDRTLVPDAETGTNVAVLLRDFAPDSVSDGLMPEESGEWRVVSLRIHGVAKPWWQFW